MEKHLNICIVHYNTPELTECLVKSINKQVKSGCVDNIYIFDNSDEKPFTYRQDNIRYIDNTKGQIIDFEEWGKNYPDKQEPFYSSKHCYSVQKFIEMVGKPFILMDSDILIRHDITDIWDEGVAFAGTSMGKRVLPFICFINPAILKEKGVSYFDDRFTYDLNKDKSGLRKYDTGYTLWANKNILPHKDISFTLYCIHYAAGSYASEYLKSKHRTQVSKERWLERNKRWWEDTKPAATPVKPAQEEKPQTPITNKIKPTISKYPQNRR